GESLVEHAAQQLAGARLAGRSRLDGDVGAESAEDLGELTGGRTGRQHRRPQALARHRRHERDVHNGHTGREPYQRGLHRRRSGVEVGVADGVGVTGARHDARRRLDERVEAAHVGAEGDEVAGDLPARLAEAQYRDPHTHTTGVPCVWNVSMVLRPHAWPLARSSRVQLIVFQSGARFSRAPALHSSIRLPPGSHTYRKNVCWIACLCGPVSMWMPASRQTSAARRISSRVSVANARWCRRPRVPVQSSVYTRSYVLCPTES